MAFSLIFVAMITTLLISIAALMSIPSSEALLSVNAGIITGIIKCPAALSDSPSVIFDATVQVVCGNGSKSTAKVVIASGLTDLSGSYFIVLNAANASLFNATTCHLSVVAVPPNACSQNLPNAAVLLLLLTDIPFRVVSKSPNVLGGFFHAVADLVQ